MENNILVVVAHPDDEVLGCGGTVSRLAAEKNNIYIAILGEGITSRDEKDKKASKGGVDELKRISCEVSKKLGAKGIFHFDLPDNRFDTVPMLDIVKKVEKLIEELAPSTVFTHYSSDINIDHQITSRAVLTAARPIGGNPVKEIYMFETPSSTEWAFGQIKPDFQPDVFYDISNTLENKIQALEMYESEMRDFPHPRSPKALTAIAQRWGSVSGSTAAEAFKLLLSIR